MKNIAEISGVVERGLRHSSGYNEEGEAFRFYDGIIGSIRSQRPFFEEIIPNFSEIHDGSINISIRPKRFDILTFDYEITCRWDPNRPSETFRFVGVDLSHEGKLYSGYVYYPCLSEWKKRPENNTFEILSPFVQNLNYGDKVLVRYSPKKIVISNNK